MKYAVKVGNGTVQVFDTYNAMVTFVSQHWHLGLICEVQKLDTRGVVFSH